MLSKFKPALSEILQPIANVMGKHVKPNHLTFIGLLFGFCAFFLISQHEIFIGAIFVLLSGLFDFLDGIVARAQKMVTDFGGFLDSVVDRYVDILIFIALGIHGIDWLMISFAMSGALLVSYTRARAEKIIERCDVGIAERSERVLILFLAMITGYIYEGMLIIAILSHFTAIHRILYTFKKLDTIKREKNIFLSNK
ncbi:MAG: CDP-alcohol phosphatidyltransferase family protein [Archaeoglobaceae archaeon]|nr:CDP-alcohol phosphatidyltransferase family protein [Archaeoglobaceae archaeon]MDW7990323.1 CDP-alcohol phosphatidyltransferase family protein [Archaeoglobaceae archaeon]